MNSTSDKKALLAGITASISFFFLACLGIWLLYSLHDDLQFQMLRGEVSNIASIAALDINIQDHKKLIKPEQTNNEFYQKVITPLVNIHNSVPNIYYLYTMVENDGHFYYILDTTIDERLQQKRVDEGADVMEEYLFDPDEQDNIDWIKSLHSGEKFIDTNYYFVDGEYVLGASVPLFDSDGKFYGLLGIDYDVGLYKKRQQKLVDTSLNVMLFSLALSIVLGWIVYHLRKRLDQVNQELYLQAHTDFLTKAYNRRYFFTQVESEIKRSLRYRRPLSLLLLDVDHFKKLNDTHGHITGDLVLVKLVEIAQQNMRSHDLISRFGGEEFSILLPETKASEAETFAKHLQEKIQQLNITSNDGTHVNFTISIGICEYQKDLDLDAWIHRTDQAMYQAKETGRNRIVCI